MRDPSERIRDTLEAIAAIERHADCTKQSFERNELMQTWFLRHLQIIGEAARVIPQEIQILAPAVPWREITGMRNVLVHGYFEIDTDLVWDTAMHDLPNLKTEMQRLLTVLEEKNI